MRHGQHTNLHRYISYYGNMIDMISSIMLTDNLKLTCRCRAQRNTGQVQRIVRLQSGFVSHIAVRWPLLNLLFNFILFLREFRIQFVRKGKECPVRLLFTNVGDSLFTIDHENMSLSLGRISWPGPVIPISSFIWPNWPADTPLRKTLWRP